MIKLEKRYLEQVREILRRIVPGYEVLAFGSRVNGHPKPFSDLDIVIMTEAPLAVPLRAELEQAFSESDLPIKVDIVDWAGTDAGFQTLIRQNCERITDAA